MLRRLNDVCHLLTCMCTTTTSSTGGATTTTTSCFCELFSVRKCFGVEDEDSTDELLMPGPSDITAEPADKPKGFK